MLYGYFVFSSHKHGVICKMRIFLSYHTPDHQTADTVANAIKRSAPGTDVFFAPYNLKLGAFWLPQLGKAIDKSDGFLLLLGENLGEWQKLEYYEAINRHLNAKKSNKAYYPVVPVITTARPPNLPFISQLHWIESNEPTAPEPVANIVNALKGASADKSSEAWRTINPYRGLLALEEQDTDFFFGREQETAAVLDAVMSDSRQLVTLIGNSGVGKSSLIQAGLIGSLKRRHMPGNAEWKAEWPDTRQWAFLTMKPGDNPVRALVSTFTRQWFTDPRDPMRERWTKDWEEMLADKSSLRALLDVSRESFSDQGVEPPKRTLLYIDQGEELYSQSNIALADRFSELIADGVGDERLTIVTSLRADYYGKQQKNSHLWPITRTIDLPPLSVDGLTQVLRRPANVLGVRFENDDLVDKIVSSAGEQAGALPLLADFMADLWEGMQKRKGDEPILRVSDKLEIFQVGMSLAKRADRFLVENPDCRDLVRRLLTLRLAHVPRQGEPMRRRIKLDICTDEERALTRKLADPDWRLLVTSEEDGFATAEVAHEILLREWQTLRSWLEAERSFLVWRDETEVRRQEWEGQNRRKTDALLQGLPLTQAEQLLATRPQDIEQEDTTYIRAGIARRNSLKLRNRAAVTATVALLTLFASGAVWQWNVALNERDTATEHLALAKKTSEELVTLIATDMRTVKGIRTETLEHLLNFARTSFNNLSHVLADDTEFIAKRASVIGYFGNANSNAGHLQEAKDLFQESHEIFVKLTNDDPENIAWQRGMADQIDNLGVVHQKMGYDKKALGEFREAFEIRRQISNSESDEYVSYRDLASSFYNLSEIAVLQGRTSVAFQHAADALKNTNKALSLAPENARKLRNELRFKLSINHISLAEINRSLGRSRDRIENILAALMIREKLVSINPDNKIWLRYLSWSHYWAAQYYNDIEKHTEALKHSQKCLAIRRLLLDLDPINWKARYDYAWAFHVVGEVYQAQDNLAKALIHYREAHRIRVDLTEQDGDNLRWRKDLALSLNKLGDLARDQKDYALAQIRYKEALEMFMELVRRSPADIGFRRELSNTHNRIAFIFKSTNDLNKARTHYENALVLRSKALENDPDNVVLMRFTATSERLVAELLELLTKPRIALEHYSKVKVLQNRIIDKLPNDKKAREDLSISEEAITRLRSLNETLSAKTY